ncbi:hypothetical protein [Nocardioides speluncae]|uniref:hypothetical protein n=1 Tax=Nocardioides speluncae TaxID=2670337 RepID=UPI000D6907E2|nr:hypothetical protein [Nocardioides speluncae]
MQIPSEHDDGAEVIDEQVESTDELADEAVDRASAQTGVASVDQVLDSLDALDEQPVEEHVAVFEQAHERLRGALDAPASSIPAALRPDA